MDERHSLELKPVGIIHSPYKNMGAAPYQGYNSEEISQIEVFEEFEEGLKDIEGFSHIIVIYWTHQSNTPPPKKVHPRGRHELPLMGVLATRSPSRPNPIGKTTARLLKHQGNILTVRGLDAIDGTPVIDIKPYIPGYDSAKRAKAPPWAAKP